MMSIYNIYVYIVYKQQLFYFCNFFEQLLARLFKHLDYEVEALTTFVVWVGNIVVGSAVSCKVVAHTIHLIYMRAHGRDATDTLIVAVVHNHYAVEIVKIRHSKWA